MSLNLGINNLSLLGGYGVTGGLSSFGGLFGMNNSIFTNCFGEINYDAVAGYQVANVVGNIAFAAIGQAIGNKQAAKAHNPHNKHEERQRSVRQTHPARCNEAKKKTAR